MNIFFLKTTTKLQYKGNEQTSEYKKQNKTKKQKQKHRQKKKKKKNRNTKT